MSQIEGFLQSLGLTVKRERGEYRTQCPWCGDDDHLYVNAEDGRCHCHKCSNPGKEAYGPYVLAEKLTGKLPAEVNAILDEYGLNSKSPRKSSPPKKYTPDESLTMTDSETARFCKAKSLDANALHKFKPRIQGNIILLPASNTKTLTGQLRCHIDGDLITLSSGKQEKYPMSAGGRHGLLGVGWLQSIEYDTIWFCEAWRDALAAIATGAVATASSGGASKWDDAWKPVFKDKTVYICMDADNAGAKAAPKAAEALTGVAKSVFCVILPYPIVPKHGKDLCYFLGAGGNIADLPFEEYISKPEPSKLSEIVLDDDMPDTMAAAFRKQSDVKYHWNSVDLWSIYSNNHYQQIEDETNIEGYIRRFVSIVKIKKKIKKDSGFITIVVPPSAKMKTDTFIKHTMKWLRDDPIVYLRPGQKSPCSLTGKLDPQFVIPMENGLLEWSKHPYILHDPTPDFYSLQRLPFKWDKNRQESDMWTDYMVDATGGDEDLHTLLQQWAGYCFMKGNQDAQKFIILYGEAGTGKNVYSEVLSAGLGLENVSVVPLVNFNEPHLVTQTYGKMLNITDESETHLEQGIESALKHYTGGGQYQFKRMYGKPFSAYPTAKIMILTNHLPAFTDTSNGIWRRLLVAPFDFIVPDDKRIEGFANQIIETEMSGVLAWALAGARSLMKYGFIVPEKCKQVAINHRLESVPEIQFMQENIEACDPDEVWGRISCSQFREAYEKFCKGQGVLPKGMRNLSKTIRKLFPLSERKRGRADGDLGYFYYGLKVQNDSIYK